MQVLRYLGRHTHRISISNHRLLAFEGERVSFRWKDYAHGGKQRKMTLLATEFLCRFFLHVLPRGSVRIRHFGLPSNRFRANRLPLCRQLLAVSPLALPTKAESTDQPATRHCPRCGATMMIVERFTAAEISPCCYFDSSY
jgi:ssDNA-binding Zn-finger/Zn-ribbon topoisomerase 1